LPISTAKMYQFVSQIYMLLTICLPYSLGHFSLMTKTFIQLTREQTNYKIPWEIAKKPYYGIESPNIRSIIKYISRFNTQIILWNTRNFRQDFPPKFQDDITVVFFWKMKKTLPKSLTWYWAWEALGWYKTGSKLCRTGSGLRAFNIVVTNKGPEVWGSSVIISSALRLTKTNCT
jgi:hypothetical protein